MPAWRKSREGRHTANAAAASSECWEPAGMAKEITGGNQNG